MSQEISNLFAEETHEDIHQEDTHEKERVNFNISDEEVIEYLVDNDSLSKDGLMRAQKISESSGEATLPLLLKLGSLSDKNYASALAALTNCDVLDEKDLPKDVDLEETGIAPSFFIENQLVPVHVDESSIDVVMTDPRDEFLRKSLAMSTGKTVKPLIGLRQDIERILLASEKKQESDEDSFGVDESDIEHLKDLASEAPVIRRVSAIIQAAVEAGSSDIHIEPFENRMKVRYRVDGVLTEAQNLSSDSSAAIVSRIKIMAKLNIAERRLPQDGRIQLRLQGKELDLRVSTVPTMYGESVVMRILDRESVVFDFDRLGFEGKTLEHVLAALEKPNGIFLVTGPTGSGKSTTLYTALNRVNQPTRKIITAEDPVEYQLEGVNQIHVKPQIGLTFAAALRSIVRQDPDIIMVGEMRDLETSQIAVQSALTGHLVLSTLHTNDAPSAINRLVDMGVDDYMISSVIVGVLAQRLVRQLCNNCKMPEVMPEDVRQELLRLGAKEISAQIYQPSGCRECNHTGYRGRLAITEFMPMTENVRRLIIKKSTAQDLMNAARREGMHTLYEDGLMKVNKGQTALSEVLRVTQDSE